MIVVEFIILKGTSASQNCTDMTSSKLEPVIITFVPPFNGPLFGFTSVIDGIAARLMPSVPSKISEVMMDFLIFFMVLRLI